MKRHLEILLLCAAVGFAGAACATEDARKILDRRKELDATTRAWTDRHQRMKLNITSRRGDVRVRELDLYERKYPGNEQKAIVFLLAPEELKGTGFLAFTHAGRGGEQWLYVPALKRVRQISGNRRGESFVGTDFTFQDLDLLAEMPSWSEADASSTLRGEEVIDDTPCHVIALTPQRADIGYKQILLWLGREDLMPRRIELYDQAPSGGMFASLVGDKGDKQAPKKRVQQADLRLVGPVPVAHRVTVESPGAGTNTSIEIIDVKLNQGMADDLFTQRHLERGGQ
jgi:hypothetical protein